MIDSSATPTNLAIIHPTIINIGTSLNNGDWRFTPFFKCNLLLSIDLANSPSLSTIGDRAFSDCSNLSNILFPPSLSIVGEYAFYKCGFTSLSLPDSLTTIGRGAFQKCEALSAVRLPTSLMTLNSYVFQGTALINVDLGKLRSVGEGCFSCCSSLSKVSCGDSLTRISDFVFHKCSELRVVENLHRGVAVGGASPFADCPLLLRDVVGGGVDVIRSLNKRAEFWSRKRWIILAFLRFEDCVDKGSGSEQDKVNRALAKVYE